MCRCPYHNGTSVFLRYIGILTVFRFAGIKLIFLLNIDTAMTKIPSFQFFCGIVPSSNAHLHTRVHAHTNMYIYMRTHATHRISHRTDTV